MPYVTFFRGTREAWEQSAIEGGALLSYRQQLATVGDPAKKKAPDPKLAARPYAQLSMADINKEVVARVGVETALGTVNSFSHFVPLGTIPEISLNFGGGICYIFVVDCVLIDAVTPEKIGQALKAAKKLIDNGAVPVFKGGNHEYLAYTGTVIDLPQKITKTKMPPRYMEAYGTRLIPTLESAGKLPYFKVE